MADVDQERVTALWREAAASLATERDLFEIAARDRDIAQDKLFAERARSRELEDECAGLREQLDAARHLARVNAAGFNEHEERADGLQDECAGLREQLDAARHALEEIAAANPHKFQARIVARAALGVEGE